MTKKKIGIIFIVIVAILGCLFYLAYPAITWILYTPRVDVYSPDTLIAGKFTFQDDVACKVAGSLCWWPTRGFFDYDTAFYVYKKDKTCNLDYHVEEKNDKAIFLTVSEVDCNLKGSDAKDGEVFSILNIDDQRELSKLNFTYKFHDGSPDSHNIINLVK